MLIILCLYLVLVWLVFSRLKLDPKWTLLAWVKPVTRMTSPARPNPSRHVMSLHFLMSIDEKVIEVLNVNQT